MGKLSEKLILNAPHFIQTAAINLYGYKLYKARFGPDFFKLLNEFEAFQYKSKKEIEEYKVERAAEVVKIAETTPYYHKLFLDHGINVNNFSSLEDLKKIPLLTKKIIRENYEDLIVPNYQGKTVTHWTSGTTGAKMKFVMPHYMRFKVNAALHYRSLAWSNVKVLDKRVTLGGRLFTKKPPYWIYNRAEKQLLLSIHHLREDTAEGYLKKIQEFKPRLIQGHPSGVYGLAVFAQKMGIKIEVPLVHTTGETMFPEQRDLIQEVFKTTIQEGYGSGETVIAASSHPKTGLFHEVSEIGHIELTPNENSKYSSVIGTSFYNHAMPFIRYEMNDMVLPLEEEEVPEIDINLPPVFSQVIGRVDDFIYDCENKKIFPVTIRMAIKPLLKHFESYQFIQLDHKRYELHTDLEINESREKAFLTNLIQLLGEGASIKVHEKSPVLSAGGKLRTVKNNIKN